MDIRIHPEFLERLSQIDWFARVFEPDEISTYLSYDYVKSWGNAKPLFCSLKWEATATEAGNALFDYVGIEFPELLGITRNEMASETRSWVDTHVMPVAREVMERHALGEVFLQRLRWDVIYIIMEDIYRDTNPPSLFFAELLKFYEAGHFPCGWKKGRWPKGTLMVA